MQDYKQKTYKKHHAQQRQAKRLALALGVIISIYLLLGCIY